MSDAQEAILEREAAWGEAICSADFDRMRGMMSDDCTIAHGSGIIEGRDQALASMPGRIEVRASSLKDVRVRVSGGGGDGAFGVVTGLQVQQIRLVAEGDGGFFHSYSSITRVWQHAAGEWRLIRSHMTRRTAVG